MYIKKIVLFVLLLNFIFLFACENSNDLNNLRESTESTETVKPQKIEYLQELGVVYVRNDSNLKMDIYYPTKIKNIDDKYKLIMMLHGGGWIAGDKTQPMYMFKPIIDELRENGYIVVMPQYSYALNENNLYGILGDINIAFLYLYENREKYNIDLDSIGIMGYSAGAHLAMLHSYIPNETKDFMDIKYCLSFAGPSKFYGDELFEYPETTLYLIENLFNGTYEEKEEEYIQGSPYAYLEFYEYIEKVPLLFIHDEYDNVVPFNQSQVMCDKAVELGIDCELIKLNGFYHQIDFNYYKNDEIINTILDFIYKYS
ncbi:MAG: alpha/beta hydrolase [Oscillospiraceae bacterium]|nr:alpha/beta hydrolase [Oscillospiraceae bacterium]